MLSSSSWQGLLCYPLHQNKVCYVILFIMTRSVMLSSSSWQGQLCYPLHQNKVCYVILFIITLSAIWPLLLWPALLSCPATSDTCCAVPGRWSMWQCHPPQVPTPSATLPPHPDHLSSCPVTISRSYLEGGQHGNNIHLMFPHHLPEVLRGVW